MKPLKWKQVHAWRLTQHNLYRRLKRKDLLKAVTRTGGIQAQVLSAAELAIGARVDGLSPQDVKSALWKERTLIKTWAMRGTLHLVTPDDLSLYAAARNSNDEKNWINYFVYYGITAAQYEIFMAAVSQVLNDQPMTREQLATAIGKFTGIPKLRDLILTSNWGSPLKPSAFRGDLCFGPSQGQNVTFVNPQKWTGISPQLIEPETAQKEVLRRYLQSYGPATPENFVRWRWGGSGLTTARKLFKSMEAELEEFNVEGWHASALKTTLKSLEAANLQGSVNLLPLFDAYILGHGRDFESILPMAYKSRVFRPQGWISATIVVDGSIKGVWEYKTRPKQTTIKISMFSPPTTPVRKGIEAEAERLGVFLNSKIALEYDE
jgi:hypothetical protein